MSFPIAAEGRDESYSESVKRLLRTDVTSEENDLFAFAVAKQKNADRAIHFIYNQYEIACYADEGKLPDG